MICSASCGNRVATRCDRASAVCFIGPQRPSAAPSSTTGRRRAPPPPTPGARSRPPRSPRPSSSHRDAGPAAQRPPALRSCGPRRAAARRRTPRRRDAPVSSPAAPASRRSCCPRRPALRSAKTGAARCRRAGAAPSGYSVSPSASRVTQPCRRSSRSSSCSRRTSSAARAAELALDRLDVDVVQGRAGVLLAELVEQVVEVGDLAQRAGRLAVAERLVAAHPLAPVPAQVGPQRAQVVGRARPSRRPSGPSPSACAISWASSSRCCGRERAHQPLAGGGPAGQDVDQLVDVRRVLREELAVLGHELGERVGRCPRPRACSLEQVVEVAPASRPTACWAGRVGQRVCLQARRTAARRPPAAARRGSAGTARGPRRWPSRSRTAPRPPARSTGAGCPAPPRRTGRRRRRGRRSASRSAARAWSSSCWARVTAPSRLPRRSASRRIRRARAGRSSSPRPSARAAAQQVAQRVAQAAAGQHLARRPSSTAARTSYGGASGSGPPSPRAVPVALIVARPDLLTAAVDGAAVVGAAPWTAGGSGAAPPARTRRRRPPRRGSGASPRPSRSSTLASPGTVPTWRSTSSAATSSPVSMIVALGDQVGEAGQVEAGQPGPERLGGRGAQQVGEDLDLPALLAALELDLAAQRAGHRHGVADPGHRLGLAEQPGPAQRGRRDRLGGGDREPGRDAGAGVDRRRLAHRRG